MERSGGEIKGEGGREQTVMKLIQFNFSGPNKLAILWGPTCDFEEARNLISVSGDAELRSIRKNCKCFTIQRCQIMNWGMKCGF